MQFHMQGTGRDLAVVCNHSPKGRQWQKRGNAINNKVVLGKYFKVVQQTHGADTPVPQALSLCEDFNLPPRLLPGQPE